MSNISGWKIGIIGFCSYIAETIQPPACASAAPISQGLLFVEIHQQRGVRKRVEPDIDKRFLIRKRRHMRTPAFPPIAYRRDIDAVEIRMPVIALASFAHELSPILKRKRIRKIRLPNRSVLMARLGGPPRPDF